MTPRFVLDTDCLTHYIYGHPQLTARIGAQPREVALTVVTVQELFTGWYRMILKARPRAAHQNLADSVDVVRDFPILTFTDAAMDRYEQLRALRINVGKMVLRIAAIVLDAGATLVTRDRRDFDRVPGLVLDDWGA